MGCGAPMVLLMNAGLLFAPAAHGGALSPGVMPLMVALLAARYCLGLGRHTWNTPEHWPCSLPVRRIGMGRLHSRHAARAARWPARRGDRSSRLDRSLSTGLCEFCPSEPAPSTDLRCGTASSRAGNLDCDRGVVALRAHGWSSRRNCGSGVRGVDASHDRTVGHSGARRMAFCDRLDRYHIDLGRRVPRQRRTTVHPLGEGRTFSCCVKLPTPSRVCLATGLEFIWRISEKTDRDGTGRRATCPLC